MIFGCTFIRITYLQSGVSLSYCLQRPKNELLVASSIWAKSEVWLWPLWLGASSIPITIQHWRQILGCICLIIGAVIVRKSLKRAINAVNYGESTWTIGHDDVEDAFIFLVSFILKFNQIELRNES